MLDIGSRYKTLPFWELASLLANFGNGLPRDLIMVVLKMLLPNKLPSDDHRIQRLLPLIQPALLWETGSPNPDVINELPPACLRFGGPLQSLVIRRIGGGILVQRSKFGYHRRWIMMDRGKVLEDERETMMFWVRSGQQNAFLIFSVKDAFTTRTFRRQPCVFLTRTLWIAKELLWNNDHADDLFAWDDDVLEESFVHILGKGKRLHVEDYNCSYWYFHNRQLNQYNFLNTMSLV